MKKIIDTFLYFNEIDLLKIRLEYLFDLVDLFIIVEHNQTFNGKKKEFNYEKHSSQIEKYKSKIIYKKFINNFSSHEEIINYLKSDRDNPISSQIKNNLLKPDYYKKYDLNFSIESYQKDTVLYPLTHLSLNENDIIINGDVDEIPYRNLIYDFKKMTFDKIYALPLNHHNYKFDLINYDLQPCNFVSSWKFMKKGRFQHYKWKSKLSDNMLFKKDISCGYHFSAISSGLTKDRLLQKINSFSHQELNNKFIINNIEKIIESGIDILSGNQLKQIELNDQNYFDTKMNKIINKYIDKFEFKKITIRPIFRKFYKIMLFLIIKKYFYKMIISNFIKKLFIKSS